MVLARKKNRPFVKGLLYSLLFVAILSGIGYAFPLVLTLTVEHEQTATAPTLPEQFPVTVDPRNKMIVENAQVNIRLESALTTFEASVANVAGALKDTFAWIAITLSETPWYQNVAAVGGRFVTIDPGMRKEQVATEFGSALGWNTAEKKEFTTGTDAELALSEGSFAPGVYFVNTGMTPSEALALVKDRFAKDILSHYGPETASVVPLNDALTVASLIQREASADDMRIVSGIIWKRLFSNMKLQIDATVQYAKADKAKTTTNWWPKLGPGETSIKSAYNTYLHAGLPPTPIASPSVAAVLAALNPVDTSCLFYFHDKKGTIHCTETYAEHMALLKKYYSPGK